MRSNLSMRMLLEHVGILPVLHQSLYAIATSGFVTRDGCYLISSLLNLAKSAERDNFHDCTGYECFVNSVHVEDYTSNAPLPQALQFVDQVFICWRATNKDSELAAIISVDEYSVVVKFHVSREGEHWLSENTDGYEDPVLLIFSTDDLNASIGELRGGKESGNDT